ncbi:MAG: integrin alpha [Hyphomonadaceae bacterium]
MKALLAAPAFLFAACSAPAVERADVAALMPCTEWARVAGEAPPAACVLQAGDATLRVTYEEMAEGADGGDVRVEVLRDNGSVVQTFVEQGVSEYLPANIEDIDGDGRADVLIPLYSGNVNTGYGVWIYRVAQGAYRRAGEISAVEILRTNEGYLATQARSSCCSWGISFYRVGAEALELLVTLNVSAEGEDAEGRVFGVQCAIEEAPGLPALDMSEEEARAHFCATSEAEVYG